MGFKDHFSSQSAAYRRFRPAYPGPLIEYVAAQAPGPGLAVDCATGNGQAAVALAAHFDAVLAVDGSASQLHRAEHHARVRYVVGVAERLPLRDGGADLVVAAQAAHWFDFERFHGECRRVLAPGGVVAVWTYEKFRANQAVDAVIDDFYANVVGADWPAERRYVEQGYRTLPFPWRELPAPAFQLETEWDLERVLGYLATWSSVQRHKERTGRDPLPALAPRLAAAWPRSVALRLRWPIHLRIGRA
jgi:SAM-dependent methyltransferase